MLSQISLVILSWFSSLDPAAADVVDQTTPIAAVQLELLPDHESAQALAEAMQRRLGSDLEVFVETVGGEAELPPSYRVGVGPFSDYAQAERAQLTLEQLGVDGFIRAHKTVWGSEDP